MSYHTEGTEQLTRQWGRISNGAKEELLYTADTKRGEPSLQDGGGDTSIVWEAEELMEKTIQSHHLR